MKQFFDFVFHPRKNPRYVELKKYGIEDTLKVTIVVNPLVSFAMLLFLVMSYIWPESYGTGELLVGYRNNYFIMLSGLLIYEVYMIFTMKRFEERYRMVPFVNTVATAVLLFWALRMTVIDYYSYGQRTDPTLFMIVCFCIPFCLYIDVRIYLILMLAADVFVLYMFMRDGIDHAFNVSNLGDFIVYIFVQLIMGLIILFYKYSMREKILEGQEQKEEISKLNRSQNRFFSNMSHEIRTPINTIVGLNESILRQNVSEEINESAENIQSASEILLHLINDILDMSKFESGQMSLNIAPYHTGDMLSDIAGMLWIRAREKDLEFHIDVSPELPSELAGDEVRIKQILINVINNAIKYTMEGSVSLSIQCECDEDGTAMVTYSVSDTGIGIKKESLPHLFTAFKRVDEDKNKYIEGTGLGLSIVKQLVDLMGGTVTVDSIYTKGTTFVIRIPQKITNAEPVGEVSLESGHRTHRDHSYSGSFEAPEARVLVVDDTASNLLVVEKLLDSTKVQLDKAGSGEEALKKTLEKKYHVILMDHKMPGMDGVECLKAIRSQTGGYCHDSRVVALTANSGSDMDAKYAGEGFDGYLLKPVTGRQLEEAVYRLLPEDLVKEAGGIQSIGRSSVDWIRVHKKKTGVSVTTESVADLPKELLQRYDISTIPHMVKTDKGIFRDGVEIETRGILDYMKDKNARAEGMAPSVTDHERFFSEQLDNSSKIIHVVISSKVKNSGYGAATEAALNFGNVTVFDSGHLSSGQGLIAIEAARLAAQGLEPEAVTKKLDIMRNHVHTSFIVDTLEFLSRQKQVGKQTARLADAFMLHPVLTLNKGRMKVSRVYMGDRERTWEKYIAHAFRAAGSIDRRMLFITYVGMTKRELDKVKALVEKQVHFDEVFVQKASPTVASNCGPGTFGLLFTTLY